MKVAAKDRCECTLGPLKVEAPSIWGPGGRLDPLSGKGQCSRRATTTARGLCVCAQHARILGPSVGEKR